MLPIGSKKNLRMTLGWGEWVSEGGGIAAVYKPDLLRLHACTAQSKTPRPRFMFSRV